MIRLNPIALLGAAATLGAALGASALSLAGAPAAAAVVGGLVAALGTVGGWQAFRQAGDMARLEASLSEARAAVIDLAERQAQAEARMAETERRTIESPALVWRAATADIEVLGTLVSNLAQAVAGHEKRLDAAAAAAAPAAPEPTAEAAPAPASAAAPAAPPTPDLFEPEAELGFTADAPSPAVAAAQAATSAAASAIASAVSSLAYPPPVAVMAELKTTLAAALASDRLELCLQPIVALPQRQVRGYEATLRLKGEAGDLQDNADLRRIAAATGLEAEFDRALVERAVQVLRILRARNRDVAAICAVAGASLGSEAFTGQLESLARSDRSLIGAVTLEIAEAEFKAFGADRLQAMRLLADKGLGFGLGRPASLTLDAGEATAAGIRQLRLPIDMLLGAARGQAATDIHPADLPEFLRRRGIELMVSDVETEQSVLELLEFAAPLATGPLFGVARPVRPEVLEPKAVSEGAFAAAEPASAPSARPQRQSFRSLLRRA